MIYIPLIVSLFLLAMKALWNFIVPYAAIRRSHVASPGQGISLMPVVELLLLSLAVGSAALSGVSMLGVGVWGGLAIAASYAHMLIVVKWYSSRAGAAPGSLSGGPSQSESDDSR